MLVYSIRRLLAAIPVLLAASMFVFLLVDISGDPVAELIFQAEATGEPLSEEAQQEIAARLYHDRSMPERYWLWLTGWPGSAHNGDIGLIRGEFGPSTRGTAFDIGSDIASRLATTLRLVGLATLLGIVLGIITGVISAVRQYSKTDHIITFIGFLSLSMPVFWFGVLIKEVGVSINNAIGFRIFYTIGSQSPVREGYSAWDNFTDIAGHLILPTITLALVGYAVFSRFQRASMLEVLGSDYVRLARAKGLRNGTVMRRHALRTALIPVLTLVTIGIAGSIDGAVLTETVFQWQGLGRYFVDALGRTDTFAVMGFLMLSGTLVVVANLIADLLYAVLDPRIRYD
ncbi:ABC transporter permease [Natronosporangium hydrolyticum]|uniref:ABC transporter permease n=1 Tax=Natronosporangium hydrolyticum TaxID=2811111 RepID=A0A895YIF1_9ACTN|nr:ABC transporter permease [Natronosporangium hydrolyticum]QSB13900.1 ABC transporter permease [Natronosporangium hydrolyticum]